MDNLKEFFKGKDILVTGGCGSVGSEIIRNLMKFDVKRVRSFDNNESGQFHLQEELEEHGKLRTLMGDIRDAHRLNLAMKGVDIVFHAAALKHVPMCEYNPFEAVATNVFGTQNALNAAREEGVDRFIAISTDKAVNPINTMGATKLLGEKLVMNAAIGDFKTKFSCVRFGNVLYSSGSVIPIFTRQVMKGGPLTVTSPEMTRFFMSMEEAVGLILKSACIMKGREIFILKMKSMKIMDLADAIKEEFGPKYGFKPDEIKIKSIGIRPGEKIHEALMTEEESMYAEESDDMFIIRPGINTPVYVDKIVPTHQAKAYSSVNGHILSKKEIKLILNSEIAKKHLKLP